MNFSENQIIKKEENLLSQKRRIRNRIRLELFCINLVIALGLLLVAGFCLAGAVKGVFDSAPNIGTKELLSDGNASVVYDIDGNEIQRLNGTQVKQIYISIDNISDALKNAFLAADDPRFYEHRGVDIRGVLASLYTDVTGEGEQDLETKTITQKLLRNQFFGDENTTLPFSGLTQKIQEQYLAVKLEEELGKSKILEYYLNTINMGENVSGVQVASLFYFNKNAADLNVSEAAVLVALSQEPEKFHPIKQQENNAKQRALILDSMLEMNCISEDEYEEALGDDVYNELQVAEGKEAGLSEAQSYYVDAAISQVIDDLKEKQGYTQTRAYNAIYHSGLKIYTCQDEEIQQICNRVVKKEEKKTKGVQVSFVLTEQSTGKVKAVSGDMSEGTVKMDGNQAIDYAGEPGMVLSLLSSWLPALDTAGKTLGSVEDDSPYTYTENAKKYKVKNTSGYRGLVTMRESILNALYIPTIKTLEKVKPQTGYDYLTNLGFSTLVDKKENLDGSIDTDISLAMASGKLVNGVSNLELTAAYASIANGGKHIKPVFYTKVVDQNGDILLESKPEEKKVIKTTTAWLLTDALSDQSRETKEETVFGGKTIQTAGISGVSSSQQEYWYEGYTPYYTAGIWCGYKKGSDKSKTSNYKKMWKEIMWQIQEIKQLKNIMFQEPSDIVECDICTKCGNLAVEGLCDEAQDGNFTRKEFFARGTEPTKNCNCHIEYTICKKSGKLVTEYCPKSDIRTRIFLIKEETGKTADSPYVLPKDLPEFYCDVHSGSVIIFEKTN